MTALIVILVIVAILGIWTAVAYNGLVRMRLTVDQRWADVDVVLKRRYDLIPNLVETVKGYAAHEKGVFEAVTEARANALSAKGPAEAGRAEAAMGGALGRLFAIAEAYPQLRAVESFTRLQEQLTTTEDEIAQSRRAYNGAVQTYNTKIRVFPNLLFSGAFGFTAREFFEIEDAAAKEPVKVSFA